MLKNTYAKLCDIIDNLEVVDVIYLNGKKLYYDQILTIINNKNLFQNLAHIDDIEYCYSTDEQYGWNEYYVSDNWIPQN